MQNNCQISIFAHTYLHMYLQKFGVIMKKHITYTFYISSIAYYMTYI